MIKEAGGPCPALILAEGYKTVPAACRKGFTPDVIDDEVFADNRCTLVENEQTNIHCQKITEKEIKPGQASPKILAQPRIIKIK